MKSRTYPMNSHPRLSPFQMGPRDSARDRAHAACIAAPFKVVIGYDKIPAGRRALCVIMQLVDAETRALHLFPTLWQFDRLLEKDASEHAAGEAAAADLIVLSGGTAEALEETAERWFESVVTQRHGAPLDLLILFGADESWNIHFEESISAPASRPGRAAIRSGACNAFPPHGAAA